MPSTPEGASPTAGDAHETPSAAGAQGGDHGDPDDVESRVRRYRYGVLAACAAGFVFALWNARHQYFIYDEWTYWTQRRRLLENHEYAEFFLQPHYDHWHSIVMVVWLPLDRLFGAKAYLPYLIPTIIVHCAAAFLLFELLVRTRVRPAIAAATAVLSLGLENAAGNVSFGWQIVFVTPIALCYLALLAVESYAEGGSRWFAVLTVASVVVAVVSSGVGITVMGVTALAAAARRRFALAGAVLGIPGGLYLLWRRAYDPPSVPVRASHLDDYYSYVRGGLGSTLEDIAQVHLVAVAPLLLLATIVGVALGCARGDRSWSLFAATLIGSVGFYALLASQRDGVFEASSARYVHVASALALPAIAYAVDKLIDVRRWIAVPAIAMAIFAIVANVRRFPEFNDVYVAESRRVRTEIAATVAMREDLQSVSPFAQPWSPFALLAIGQLQGLADDDKLPCGYDEDAVARVTAKLEIETPPKNEISCDGER